MATNETLCTVVGTLAIYLTIEQNIKTYKGGRLQEDRQKISGSAGSN